MRHRDGAGRYGCCASLKRDDDVAAARITTGRWGEGKATRNIRVRHRLVVGHRYEALAGRVGRMDSKFGRPVIMQSGGGDIWFRILPLSERQG